MYSEGLRRPRQDVFLLLVPGDAVAAGARAVADRRADGRQACRRLLGLPGKQLKDPITGANYPNNQIPASHITRSAGDSHAHPGADQREHHSPRPPTTSTRISGWFAAISSRQPNRLTGRWFRSYGETPAYLDPGNYLAQNTGRTWLNQSVSLTDTTHFRRPSSIRSCSASIGPTGTTCPSIRTSRSGFGDQHLYRRQAAMVRCGVRLLGHSQHG